MKTIIKSDHAPAPIGPYSQAVLAGNMLFVSGQIGTDPAVGEYVPADVETEAHQVMRNIGEVLKSAGVGYADIVKTSIFLKDMNDFGKVNAVYGSYFEKDFPARETVQVSVLPKNCKVEISVIALRS